MDLSLSLKRALSLWPQKEAIVDGYKRFTYEQFAHRVAALAHWFKGFGLKKGEVAAIIAPNCHEFMETYYAAATTGTVLNPINYRLPRLRSGRFSKIPRQTFFLARYRFCQSGIGDRSRAALFQTRDLVWTEPQTGVAYSVI